MDGGAAGGSSSGGRGLHRWLLAIFALVTGIGAVVTPAAGQTIRVLVDGTPLALDVPPLIIDGRVLVPLRGVFEHLGAQVRYIPASRTVVVIAEMTEIRLQVGSRQASIARRTAALDAPPAVVHGRVMIPLRFVGEALGAHVTWQPATRSVIIVRAQTSRIPPRIVSLTPSSGPAGPAYPIRATIRGTGFTPSGNTVIFGPVTIPNVMATENGTILTFFVPKEIRASSEAPPVVLTPGDYPVKVVNANGTSNEVIFRLTSP